MRKRKRGGAQSFGSIERQKDNKGLTKVLLNILSKIKVERPGKFTWPFDLIRSKMNRE